MTDPLPALIAAGRAASEGATEGPWVVRPTEGGPPFAVVAPAGDAELGTYSIARSVWPLFVARHIAAHPPAVTRALWDAAEALVASDALICGVQEILASYLPPDGISREEAVNQLLGLLDGPRQREVQGATEAALARLRALAEAGQHQGGDHGE